MDALPFHTSPNNYSTLPPTSPSPPSTTRLFVPFVASSEPRSIHVCTVIAVDSYLYRPVPSAPPLPLSHVGTLDAIHACMHAIHAYCFLSATAAPCWSSRPAAVLRARYRSYRIAPLPSPHLTMHFYPSATIGATVHGAMDNLSILAHSFGLPHREGSKRSDRSAGSACLRCIL